MKKIPGTELFVQNVFCIGRNYAEHAKEMGNLIPAEPVVFLKPTSAICYEGDEIILPPQSKRVDHELEIVLAIGKLGRNVAPTDAVSHIAGIGVGIDLTARDLQTQAKEKGLPWTLCKGFDTFAPISPFVSCPREPERLTSLNFELKVNGQLRQKGVSSDMLIPIPDIIAYLSARFTLTPGDLIFTGTPHGVSPLKSGDRLEAVLEDWTSLHISVR